MLFAAMLGDLRMFDAVADRGRSATTATMVLYMVILVLILLNLFIGVITDVYVEGCELSSSSPEAYDVVLSCRF
jgi:predicted enzyme involved in methoxymalonyl-ACP biosynthesis